MTEYFAPDVTSYCFFWINTKIQMLCVSLWYTSIIYREALFVLHAGPVTEQQIVSVLSNRIPLTGIALAAFYYQHIGLLQLVLQ